MNAQIINMEEEGRIKYIFTVPVNEKVQIHVTGAKGTILSNEMTPLSNGVFECEDYLIESGGSFSASVMYRKRDENDEAWEDWELEPVLKQEVIPYFEHIFLNDMQGRQLKVALNPNISGYKINVNDSVTTTLGSQYPFITRQGQVKYKTFTIGGLLTLQSDEQNYLFNNSKYSYSTIHNEDTSDNMYNIFYQERKYREAALNFLMDPSPKLYRSLTEGNILVRLTNVSLTPENTLGRCLYSFSAQATEIGDVNSITQDHPIYKEFFTHRTIKQVM